MSYGPVSVISVGTADMSPPGSPSISAMQISNKEIEAKIVIPTLDADGSPVSGLSGLVVGIAPELDGGGNPFENVAGADIKSVAEASNGAAQEKELVDADAGTELVALLPIAVAGKTYWIAAAVKDNS
jgi:hypothetical protein